MSNFKELNYEYHDFQKKALDSEARVILLQAGIQSGKTMGGAMWLIQEILKYQAEGYKYDYAIIAPTYKLLQQSTFKKFRDVAPSWLGTWKEQKSVYELTDGGNIYVRSADDPDSLEGMTLKAAWLDEAGQMPERVWSIIYGRLNILQGRMILTTTPYVHCWIDDVVIPQWEDGNKDYEVIMFESIASPWFPVEEYEQAKKVLSPSEFSRRYRGILINAEGLVYDGWNKEYVWDELPEGWHIKEYAAGIDFGYNHPAAIEVGAFSDDFPAAAIVDEWYESGRTIDELIAAALEFKKKYNVRIFYADPSRPEYIQQLNHAGVPTMGAKNEVQAGLDKVRALMYTGNLRVLKKCRGLLQERKRYRYPDGSVGSNEPIKIDDDASDAERYLMFSHYVRPAEKKKASVGDPIWEIIKAESKPKDRYTEELSDWLIDSSINDEVF